MVPDRRPLSSLACLVFAALAAASGSCALFGSRGASTRSGEGDSPLVAARRESLAASAKSLIGRTGRMEVRGRSFAGDCTGTVLAACWGAGLDLAPAMARQKGTNGVTLLYRAFEEAGLLLDTDSPRPGDILFWDDTWDANGNGKADDPLTHAGIVVSANGKGGLSYVHYRYDLGVVEEYMDLSRPSSRDAADGSRANSSMRMRSWRPVGDDRALSGELYRDGGSTPRFPHGWDELR